MKKIFLTFFFFTFFSTSAVAEPALLLFGGSGHDVFLGCINCSKYDDSSIWNKYGTYGSKYNSDSIWNKYGTYGSKYNSDSPWNKYTSTPPVIVDREGNFYGYLTTNKYFSQKSTLKLADILCEFHEEIREDVSEWYDKIFR